MILSRSLRKYTQESCDRALLGGLIIGFPGENQPETEKITTPHEIVKVVDEDSGVIIGYNIVPTFTKK